MPAGRQGFAQIIVVIAAVVVLVLAGTAIYLFVIRRTANPTGNAVPSSYVAPVVDTTQAPVPAVKSAADLKAVSADLDATGIDSLNSALDQNAADAAGF